MDQLLSTLFSMLDSLATEPGAAQTGFALMLGLAVFTFMVAGVLLFAGLAQPIRRRIRKLEPSHEEESSSSDGKIGRVIEPVGDLVDPGESESRNRVQQRLRHAGITDPDAIRTYYGVKLLLVVTLPVLVGLILFSATRVPGSAVLLLGTAGAITGYLIPSFWLNHAVRKRTTEIRRALPDALDLLVVCSEAGLGLSAAIQRVSSDLEISHPVLAHELSVFNMQTRAGMSNRDALRDLEARCGVEDVRGLVTTLLQSMRFGTSVAATLRIYSDELRDKRIQRAEENAATVGTKMLFPLVLCIFPSFFVVTLGPPILGAIAALNTAG